MGHITYCWPWLRLHVYLFFGTSGFWKSLSFRSLITESPMITVHLWVVDLLESKSSFRLIVSVSSDFWASSIWILLNSFIMLTLSALSSQRTSFTWITREAIPPTWWVRVLLWVFLHLHIFAWRCLPYLRCVSWTYFITTTGNITIFVNIFPNPLPFRWIFESSCCRYCYSIICLIYTSSSFLWLWLLP